MDCIGTPRIYFNWKGVGYFENVVLWLRYLVFSMEIRSFGYNCCARSGD